MPDAQEETPMPLRVAVQMDPLDKINIAGDSSFALMLTAQARGHAVYHYAPENINYADGHVWTQSHPETDQLVAGEHFSVGPPVRPDLGDKNDLGMMRQDPPVPHG